MQLMNFLSANTALVICYILDVILVFIILATLCFVYLKSNKSNSETPTKSNKLDSNENNNQLEPAIPADYFNSEESNEIAYILLEDGYKPIEISKIKQATKFNKNHDSTIKKSENLKKSETLQKKPKKQPKRPVKDEEVINITENKNLKNKSTSYDVTTNLINTLKEEQTKPQSKEVQIKKSQIINKDEAK